ncbi:unnamed protein product [Miscanthus lutarioriparius]|uniref:Uncharacterized protein n=1 Tax=Miscanthus lutarioriparius TaxID=422564 RepID=A0A811MG40_9POAL|nr:unnamed protein product [Miscanthus lutarioriparius]
MGEFDDYWARAYRSDSGVPHSNPQRLVSTWTGAFALGTAACVHHHASALTSHLSPQVPTHQVTFRIHAHVHLEFVPILLFLLAVRTMLTPGIAIYH